MFYNVDAQTLDGMVLGVDRIESLINLPRGFAKNTHRSDAKLVYTSDEDLHSVDITYCLEYKNKILYKITKTTVYHRTGSIYNAKNAIEKQIINTVGEWGAPSYSIDGYMYWKFNNAIASFSYSTDIIPYTSKIGHSEITLELTSNLKVSSTQNSSTHKFSGSGFVISTNGIIVTNYHLVKAANGINVLINKNGEVKTYKAKVLISDKTNDISLLKIDDDSFAKFATIPYAVNTRILDVGTSVFALGYPMSNILGEEIKLTDGLISSKTGYQGDIVTYQISAPIQPGNSGGPLFDKNGNIVGITNAGVPDAQNVGYAIKASYLRNLIDVAPETITLPTQNSISGLSFTEKIKRLTPYVVLIKVY